MRFHGMAAGEERAATRLGVAAGVEEHRFFSMPELRELGDIGPLERLAGLPSAYIPMKNSIYYNVAAAFAEEVGAGRVVGGHNGDDRAVYEDTSDAFFRNLQRTLRSGSARLRQQDFRIWRPLQRDEQGGGGGAGVDPGRTLRDDLELPQGGQQALLGVRRMPREGPCVPSGGGPGPVECSQIPKGYKTGSSRLDSCVAERIRTKPQSGPS